MRVPQVRNRDTTHIFAQTHTDQVRQMVLPNATSFIPTLETTIQTPLPVTTDEHGFIDLDQLLQERRARNTRMCAIGHMAATDIEIYFDQHGGYYSHRDFVRVSQDILTIDFAIPNSSNEEDPAKSEATRNCMMRIFEEHAYALEDEGNTVQAKRIFAATANFISAIATCDGPENSPEQIRNCALEIIRENIGQIEDDDFAIFIKIMENYYRMYGKWLAPIPILYKRAIERGLLPPPIRSYEKRIRELQALITAHS